MQPKVVRRFRSGAALLRVGDLYTVVHESSQLSSLLSYPTASAAVSSCSLSVAPSRHARDDLVVELPEYKLRERLTTLSRSAAAVALLRMRAQLPVCGVKHHDGALLGVKALRIDSAGTLHSPQRGTEWPGPALIAEEFSFASAVEGKAGVHALWPRRDGEHAQCVKGYLPERRPAVAVVAGYGRYVTGKIGWRAEKVLLQTVYVPTDLADAVQSKYREAEVRPSLLLDAYEAKLKELET